MNSNPTLERTINKVLSQKETDLITQIDSAYQQSLINLEASRTKLEHEYNRIIEGARKQAENLKRQVIGSSRLAARNKQLIMIETTVNQVFQEAKTKLSDSYKEESYNILLTKMIEESVAGIGSNDVIIECNKNDFGKVKNIISDLTKSSGVKIKLSEQPLNNIGGIRIMSADGSMSYDNTLDSRIERLKPLIRKNIVQLLKGVE